MNSIEASAFAAVCLLTTQVLSAGRQATSAGKKPAVRPPAPRVAASTPPPAPAGLSVNDIITMLDAKISETIIVAKVKKNAAALDPSTDQLVALKKAGASDSLMEVLFDPSKPYTPPAPPPPPAPARPDPVPPAPAAVAAPVPPSATNLEIGVYLKKGTEWMERLRLPSSKHRRRRIRLSAARRRRFVDHCSRLLTVRQNLYLPYR